MDNILACPSSSSKFLLPRQQQNQRRRFVIQAVKSPKGFGANSPLSKQQNDKPVLATEDTAFEENEERRRQRKEAEEDEVPEIVTNRMLSRMAFTVGTPMAVGVAFFGLFYYLKGVLKLDVPEWLPVATSFLTFGTSGLGISYAVISTSWDPAREGSFLGWTEAKANWPVLWENKPGQGRNDDE